MATKKDTMQVGDLTITPSDGKNVTLSIDGKKTTMPFKELWSAVFVLSGREYKAQMIPASKEERMVFSRKLRIRASKDIKAGEEIVTWVEFDVSRSVVESIAEKEGAKVLEPSALSTGAPEEQSASAL